MQTSKKKNWFLIVGLSLTGVCLLGCIAAAAIAALFPSLYQVYLKNSSLAVGDPAPDFELRALSGEKLRLSQYLGQPVLLNFSASWCPDCRKEVPLLQELHIEHPELVIVLVDIKEPRTTVKDFAEEFGMDYPVLMDLDGRVSNQYQVLAIPTALFIDQDGIIQAKLIEAVTPELLAKYLPSIGVQP